MLLNILVALFINTALANDTIHYVNTKTIEGSSSNYYPPKYYMKVQNPWSFHLVASSQPVFVQTPGLSLSFYHPMPMLYEISFHGNCRIDYPSTCLQLHLRVDGQLILGNYLSSDMTSDHRSGGAYMISNEQTHGSTFQCSKTDWIYLSAGIHVIDVAAKTSGAGAIEAGILRVKLIQFDDGTNINLPIMTPPIVRSV